MDDRERRKLADVLVKLMTHPCMRIFIEPVQPGLDCPDHYFELISQPSSLSEVLHDIKEYKCNTREEYMRRVDLCWSNAELYYGELHPIGVVAAEGRRQFHKILNKYGHNTPETFCHEVQRLQTKMGTLIEQMSTQNTKKAEFTGLSDLMTDEELEGLMIGCDMLKDPNDYKHIRTLIKKHQPELLNGKQPIVLTRLKKSTFKVLKSFIAEALNKQGLDYPC